VSCSASDNRVKTDQRDPNGTCARSTKIRSSNGHTQLLFSGGGVLRFKQRKSRNSDAE
jgi:hypothetical protein